MDSVSSPLDLVLPTFIPPKFVNIYNGSIEQKKDGQLYLLVRINEKVTKELVVYFVESIPSDKQHEYVFFRNNFVRKEYKTALKILEIHTILDVDLLMIERSQNGRLSDIISISSMPETPPLTRQRRIQNHLTIKILQKIADKTFISYQELRVCFDWCERYKGMLESLLLGVKSENKNIRYIVVKKHYSLLPYNFEYREGDIRLRIKKDVCKGTLTRYSYHVDLLSGDFMLKGKRLIKNDAETTETTKREIDQKSIVKEAEIINKVNDIEGVIKYVRAPELHSKVRKGKTIFYSFIFCEFLNYKNLLEHIVPTKVFSTKESCKFLGDLCTIVDKIHKKNIFHRDLKPENIMFHRDEEGNIAIKIIDFDMADLVSNQYEKLVGSPHYIDPYQYYIEQRVGTAWHMGKPRGSVESDTYTLGVIAFAWLTVNWPKHASEMGNQDYSILTKENGEYNVEGINESISESMLSREIFETYPALKDNIVKMMEAHPQKRIHLLEAGDVFYQVSKTME